MKLKRSGTSRGLIPLAAALLLLATVAVYNWVSGARLDSHALSGALDATSAIVALTLGAIIVLRDRVTPMPHLRPAGLAFIAIGVLQAIDVPVVDLDTQTMLNTLSTAAGGLLYALVLLPEQRRPDRDCSDCWVYAATGAMILGAMAIVLEPWTADVITSEGLGLVPIILDVIGSALLLAASVHLVWRGRRERDVDQMVFGGLALMLGISGILFGASQGRTDALTSWQIFTLAGYVMAAVYMVVRYGRLLRETMLARETAESLNVLLGNIRRIDRLIAGGKQTPVAETAEALGSFDAYAAVLLTEREPDGTPARSHVFGSGAAAECLESISKCDAEPPCQKQAIEADGAIVHDMGGQCEDCAFGEASSGTVVTVALRHRGTLYGTLTIAFLQSIDVTHEELQLIEGVADDLAQSMDADRLISEREKALQAAATEQQWAEQIIENAPALIFGMNVDGEVTLFNRQCEEVTGYSRQEVLGESLVETFIPGAGSLDMEDFIASLLEHGGPVEYENRWRTRDGNERLISWRNTVRRDADGNVEIIAIGIDVTEHREIEELYTELVERMGEGVSVVDTEGRYTYVNRALAEFFGLPAEEMMGRHPTEFASEQGRRVLESELEKRRTGADESYEVEWETASGEAAWSVVSPSARFDRNGEYVGAFSVSTDITQRKLMERRLAEHTEALERSNQELEEFARVVSHDLQEPLRKIRAFGDRLGKMIGDDLEERPADYLDRLLNATVRMQNLIEALLGYSRVTSRAQPFTEVDLNQAVEDARWDLEVAIEEVGGSVEHDDLPTIEAEPSQMRQLIQNLVQNAMKFRKEDVPPHVDISARIEEQDGIEARIGNGEICELTVSDNGVGFDQKYADRIFGVFERLHRRGEYAGTGMGLAICRKIVDRHGGTIQAQSEPGEGTTFTIRVPVHQAEEDVE